LTGELIAILFATLRRGNKVEGQARLHLRQAVAGVSSKRNAVVIYRRRGFLEVFFEK